MRSFALSGALILRQLWRPPWLTLEMEMLGFPGITLSDQLFWLLLQGYQCWEEHTQ